MTTSASATTSGSSASFVSDLCFWKAVGCEVGTGGEGGVQNCLGFVKGQAVLVAESRQDSRDSAAQCQGAASRQQSPFQKSKITAQRS